MRIRISKLSLLNRKKNMINNVLDRLNCKINYPKYQSNLINHSIPQNILEDYKRISKIKTHSSNLNIKMRVNYKLLFRNNSIEFNHCKIKSDLKQQNYKEKSNHQNQQGKRYLLSNSNQILQEEMIIQKQNNSINFNSKELNFQMKRNYQKKEYRILLRILEDRNKNGLIDLDSS